MTVESKKESVWKGELGESRRGEVLRGRERKRAGEKAGERERGR